MYIYSAVLFCFVLFLRPVDLSLMHALILSYSVYRVTSPSRNMPLMKIVSGFQSGPEIHVLPASRAMVLNLPKAETL